MPASHVTLNAGTGLVHTAPAHGPEDYLVGVDHGLDLSCPVGEDGKFDKSVVQPEILAGKEVLKEGSEKIMDLLGMCGHKRSVSPA